MLIEAYVPTCPARCDQHAVKIDGEVIGLLSASKLGEMVRGMIPSRPSAALQADMRREAWLGALEFSSEAGLSATHSRN